MRKRIGMKRALAIAMAATVAMSVCAMPAFAGNGKGAPDLPGAAAGVASQPAKGAGAGGLKTVAMAYAQVPESAAREHLKLSWDGAIVSGKPVTVTASWYNQAKSHSLGYYYEPYAFTCANDNIYGPFAPASGDRLSLTFYRASTKSVTVNYYKYVYNSGSGSFSYSGAYSLDFNITVKGTVNFWANGGSPSKAKYKAQGKKLSFPGKPKRHSFRFDGWYTSAIGGKKLTSRSTVHFGTAAGKAAVMNVYAHWAKKVRLSFNAGKGSLTAAQKEKYENSGKPYRVTTSERFGALPEPSRDGYRFFGWWQGGNRIGSHSYVTKTSDQSLKAKWLKKGSGKALSEAEFNVINGVFSSLVTTKKPGYLMSLGDLNAIIGFHGAYVASYTTANGYPVKIYRWKLGFASGYLYGHFVKGKYFGAYSADKSYREWQTTAYNPILP